MRKKSRVKITFSEDLDILFVQPRGSNWLPGYEDVIVAANLMPPIGLCCLVAYLEQNNFESAILDCFLHTPANGDWADYVLQYAPKWIGFSCTTSSFLDGYSMAKSIKEKNPDVNIVFGSVHVSALREQILRDYPAIDYLVVGEGEKTIVELLQGKNPANIEGLVYRENGEIKFTGFRRDLLDLDTLPFPAYHRLPGFPKYYYLPIFNYPRAPNCTLITSRGCPYRCSYCDRSVYRKGFRFNSAEYIYEHMKFLKQNFGIKHVTFYDDLFTYDRERVMKLCEMLTRNPIDMGFNCIVQLAHVDQEILNNIKHAGGWMVNVGIETGDPLMLKKHKTHLDLSKVIKKVQMIKKAGLRVKGLFIMGLPGETEESIKATTRLIKKLELDDMNMAKFAPYPGAPVYPKLKSMGALIEDWSKMNGMNFLFLPESIESFKKLESLYNQFIDEYYQTPRFFLGLIKMLWKSPHSWYRLIRDLPIFLRARKAFN